MHFFYFLDSEEMLLLLNHLNSDMSRENKRLEFDFGLSLVPRNFLTSLLNFFRCFARKYLKEILNLRFFISLFVAFPSKSF